MANDSAYEFEPLDGFNNDGAQTERGTKPSAARTRTVNVDIDVSNLTREMSDIPSALAVAHDALASASARTIMAKAERDATRARISLAVRQRLQLDKSTRVTEAMLDDHVAIDPTVQKSISDYARAELEEGRARGVCEALRAKRDMLMMLGARVRPEDGDPVRSREEQSR